MPGVPYFARARTDLEFRRRQLPKLRWQKRLAIAGALAIALVWGTHALFAMHHQHRWAESDPLFALVLMAALYAHAANRHNTLVAMDREPPPPPR